MRHIVLPCNILLGRGLVLPHGGYQFAFLVYSPGNKC